MTLQQHIRLRLKEMLRELPYTLRLRPGGRVSADTFFFVLAPGLKHPGLADRLKAIIDCYDVAKTNGYAFRIVFKEPFALEDYLEPNRVPWVAGYGDLHYKAGWGRGARTRFYRESRMLTEESWHGRVALRPHCEYHCYSYVGNRQPRVFPESGYRWHDLFADLFRPSAALQAAIDGCGLAEHSYVAVHLRFVNALESFEEVTCCDNALATEEEKARLIRRCRDGIMRIRERHGGCPVVVFSDSSRFLDSLADLPVTVLDHSAVRHVSFGAGGDATLKTFLDLYMIARARTVYRIDAPELYAWSGFALTASMIGGVEFLTETV